MKRNTVLLIATIIMMILWSNPLLRLITIPLDFLYVYLHELGHALASVFTGGVVLSINIDQSASGVTRSIGGNNILVSGAGYVMATIFGSIVLAATRDHKGARNALFGLCFLVGFAILLFVRGNGVGLVMGLLWMGLLGLLGWKLSGQNQVNVAQFLGVSICAASAKAVFSVFGFGTNGVDNDALILERSSGIPAAFSAVLWLGVSLYAIYWGLKRAQG